MPFIYRTSVFRFASLHSVSVLLSWTIFFSLALNVYAASNTTTEPNSPTEVQSKENVTSNPKSSSGPSLPGTELAKLDFLQPEALANLTSRVQNTVLELKNSFEKHEKPVLNETKLPKALSEYFINIEGALKAEGNDLEKHQNFSQIFNRTAIEESEEIRDKAIELAKEAQNEMFQNVLKIFNSTAMEVSKEVRNMNESAIWHSQGLEVVTIPGTRLRSYLYSFAGQTDKVIAICVRVFIVEPDTEYGYFASPDQNIPATLALFRIILALERFSKSVKASKYHGIDFHFLLDGRSNAEIEGLAQYYQDKKVKASFLMVNKVGCFMTNSRNNLEAKEYFSKPFVTGKSSYGSIINSEDGVQINYYNGSSWDYQECGLLALKKADCTLYSGQINPAPLRWGPDIRFFLSDPTTMLTVDLAVVTITRFILAHAVEYTR